MQKPDVPINEKQRLHALKSYKILDTLPEEDLDNITRLASDICQTPISYISLIDRNRQWFKSVHGANVTETPREIAFCAHAINTPNQLFVVPDSREDERFFDNPLVTGDPHVVFYTGVPLINPDGYALGTLCIVDHEPRELQPRQVEALQILANQVVQLFELRKTNLELQRTKKLLETRNNDLEKFAFVLTHDIKSPLTNIISSIQLFNLDYSHLIDSKGHRLLDFIGGSASKLKNMVEGILNYYRSDPISLKEAETINLPQFFDTLLEMIETPPTATIKLPSQEEIHCNKSALNQIFLNLINNSFRYNNKPNALLVIALKEDDEYYTFTVTDNGMGIPANKVDKIFDLFTTVNKKDIKGKDSTGIGLSIVKKLVTNLGGKIKVESTPDIRTTFRFTVKKH